MDYLYTTTIRIENLEDLKKAIDDIVEDLNIEREFHQRYDALMYYIVRDAFGYGVLDVPMRDKDIEDVEGDRKQGATTLPIVFGENFSFIYARILLCVGLFLAYLPLFFGFVSFFFAFTLLPATLLCFLALKEKCPTKAQRNLKIAMYLVLLGFILGSI